MEPAQCILIHGHVSRIDSDYQTKPDHGDTNGVAHPDTAYHTMNAYVSSIFGGVQTVVLPLC